MAKVGLEKLPIARVDGTGEAFLELKGTILLYHKQTWVASSTAFIPVEWIRVSEGRRRDLRHLWRGLLGLLVTVLLALPLWLIEFRMRPHLPYDVWMETGLALLFMVTLIVGLTSLAAYARPRRTVTLSVEGAPSGSHIYFWRVPALDGAVGSFLERLSLAQRRVRGGELHPVRMHHVWRRPRPYRMVLVKGLGISFFLYLLLLCLEFLRISGYGPEFSRFHYAWLLVPPLFYLAGVALRQAPNLWEPRNFRQALRCYAKGRLREAAGHLEALLAAHPDHDPGRFLLVRALAEQFAFDDALKQCEPLTEHHPLLAARLQANLWEIKRMQARMKDDLTGELDGPHPESEI